MTMGVIFEQGSKPSKIPPPPHLPLFKKNLLYMFPYDWFPIAYQYVCQISNLILLYKMGMEKAHVKCVFACSCRWLRGKEWDSFEKGIWIIFEIIILILITPLQE
jgi:hypothetical protein